MNKQKLLLESNSDKKIQHHCSDCNSTYLISDLVNGELVCERCGIVISDEQLSRKPEWSAYDSIQREKLPRIGSPLTNVIHDKGLSTNIGRRNTDHTGRQLSPITRSKLYRLRKLNRRSKIANSKSRNLSQALNDMNTLSSKLSLPRNVFETASIVYRKALNKNMIQGRTIQSVVAVSLYIASRKCGVLRSLSDIAEKANVPRKTIARNYRYLCKNLKLEVPRLKFTDYIKRLVSRLEVNGETEILALKLVEESINNHLTNGCSPAGVAASCLYIGSKIIGEEITQHQIALEAQITEVTVRNRYKELINNFDINIFV